ncbi:hypothetical protein [Roseovarius sp. D22-M7]|uniref:hypothetical protein n=1 Tax=Roseovarius sp. D22-M7 TaxID=3127116 RepID=UPI00300FB1C6
MLAQSRARWYHIPMCAKCSYSEGDLKRCETTDGDRLETLVSFLVQTRREIIADKASLDRMFIAKAIVVASVVASATTDLLDAMIAVSPLLVMILDFVYKKRLNEIFARWKHLKNAVTPRIETLAQIRAIPGVSKPELYFKEQTNVYFEEDVIDRWDDILAEERASKSNFLMFMLFASTWGFMNFMKTDLAWVSRCDLAIGTIIYCLIIVLIYVIYFRSLEKFKDTYYPLRLALGLGAGALLTVLYIWDFIGPDLLNSPC